MRNTLFALTLLVTAVLALPAHAEALEVGPALGSVTSPPATGVLVDELAVPAPALATIAPLAHAPVLGAASPVISGFVSMVEVAALQEAANPVVWGAVLLLIVLFIAKKKKAYADAIADAAQKAYNATETLKLQGKLGQYEDKARRALAFFNTEMAKKNLTVTDAAVDAAKAIWTDLHNTAVATGTHQDAPSPVKAA